MYIDCRYGQLHLTTAYPANGGFDEAHPIVFLHADGGTGGDFGHCAALLGTDRSVYAPDLPGSGASDAAEARLPVAGLALAVVGLMGQNVVQVGVQLLSGSRGGGGLVPM